MMKKLLFALFSTGLLLSSLKGMAQYENYQMDWDKISVEASYNAEPEWLKDAKFGIYCHWGVYTVPAFSYEWYPRLMFMKNRKEYQYHKAHYGDPKEHGYEELVPLFKAERFNAREWVDLFQQAGVKFAGVVAEHHDGFAMWNTQTTPWNSVLMGPKRDIVGEMEKELRNHGLKLITTFHHARLLQRYKDCKDCPQTPDFWDMWDSHYPYIKGMPTASNNPMLRLLYGNVTPEEFYDPIWFSALKEVIDNYHPDVIWFDAWLDLIPEEYLYKFANYYITAARKRGQNVAICRKQGDLPLNVSIENLEKSRKQNIEPRLWMTDETISTDSWSYTKDMQLKDAKDLIDVLIDVVSKNGVLLLNVSPMADGTIPLDQKEVLLSIGQWLKTNGEAIYGTRPWHVFGEGPTVQPEGDFKNHQEFLKIKYSWKDVRYTTKGKDIYAILLGTPEAGTHVIFKGFSKSVWKENCKISGVSVLGTNQAIEWEETPEGLSVKVPVLDGNKAVCFKVACE